MSSSKGKARERALARAKYERQLARRAAAARRRRQLLAGLGVLALVLAGFGIAWLMGAFDAKKSSADEPEPDPSAVSSSLSDEPSQESSGSADEQ